MLMINVCYPCNVYYGGVGGGYLLTSSITIIVIKNPSEGSFQNQHPHNIKVKPLHQF